jgi:hypothetical protein
VDTAATIGVDLKAMEALRRVLRLEEFHGAFVHHTAARLLGAKPFI